MDHIDERPCGDYRIRIDRSLCVGFGDCVVAAPTAFDLDAEGVAVFLEPGEVSPDRLLTACAQCPIDAICVLDAAGRQIVPKE